ncbi:hypothetical protein [Streptomyces chartreusis]
MTWHRMDTIRPSTDNGHTAELLHSDLGGSLGWNFRCTCGAVGQPVRALQARHAAQAHVDHPEREGPAEAVPVPYGTSTLHRLAGRLRGGIPLESLDMHTLYTVRVPNGALCPGRILELDRLWEVTLRTLPSPSRATRPIRDRGRIVGLLAVANRTVAPAPADVARLLDLGRPVVPDDPEAALRAMNVWQKELSTTGMEAVQLTPHHSLQGQTFAYQLTVADPYRVLPYQPAAQGPAS